MKKLLIIMILWSISIFGEVHPNISLKYLQVKGDKGDLFLGDVIEIDRSELRFEKKMAGMIFLSMTAMAGKAP